MAQCILIKKNAMHAIKLYFTTENTVKINHIIPSSVMNAYFGQSHEQRQSIIQILTEKIKKVLFDPAQKKAFQELEKLVHRAVI